MRQWPQLKVVLQRFDRFGWLLGTCGNFSLREEETFFLSRSGVRKGEMSPEDFIPLPVQGPWPPISPTQTPSAEGCLHQVVYQAFPQATAVLHAHTPAAALAGLCAQKNPHTLLFENLEMLKGLAGVDPHAPFRLPLLANHAQVSLIAQELESQLSGHAAPPVALLVGHGVTAWGNTVGDACRHFEIAEYLCRVAVMQKAGTPDLLLENRVGERDIPLIAFS